MTRRKSHPQAEALVESFRSKRPIRAGSLIITVYGDAIAPHGGTVWLGSLIRLLEPLGLSQRLVRTSVFRLARESWLGAEQIGRRSYYSLTGTGRARIESVHRRIYAPVQSEWDGGWHLIMLITDDIGPEERRAVGRELAWQGFGMIATGVFAHPSADMDAARKVLEDLGIIDKAVILAASCEPGGRGRPLRSLIGNCWNLDELADEYREFLDRFRPVWRELNGVRQLDPEECFLIRTLLIHDFRRVLLRDPQLPAQLLPADWAGTAARLLCRNLYRLVEGPAEAHLMATLETADGPLPEASPYYYQRFGGLESAPA
ncbi:phenylacetic acid degradation operon negative regulatory protein PaaX [Thioalbus denitrificans]|uniref:PaaX family transcriptional regulator n=1 Tax=Thioalbus denitrificans TaxID=547122 RepID=A0A369C977_9GAMM|nr:phenylacetic acid degradation operon negative regulatory protein PaaX [Thioalbus denitrificans]RCX30283.1 PaaX family transcriptional regulator [Thioalbus denitrificans]